MTDSSRWSSEATPPEKNLCRHSDPEGIEEKDLLTKEVTCSSACPLRLVQFFAILDHLFRVSNSQKIKAEAFGKTIPCWYDPSGPGIVVVQRGFGTKYIVFGLFFGLVPLVILSFGIRQLRKLSAGMRRLNASETDR